MCTDRTISEEKYLGGEPLLRGLSSVFGVYAMMAQSLRHLDMSHKYGDFQETTAVLLRVLLFMDAFLLLLITVVLRQLGII